MSALRIKKNDTVRIIAGKHKGETAKVLATNATTRKVQVEGINVVKRHIKASSPGQVGSIEERTGWIDISNVALQHPLKKTEVSKIGYKLDTKDKTKKVRIYKATGKEVK